jgi:hypothetical protein
MANKKTETYAAEEVNRSLNLSDFLDPDIKVNDKTPSVDGQVTVYNCASDKKSDLNGYVFVQVKGRQCKLKKDYEKNEISFPVEAEDLRNYRSNGGAIFFVVYIYNKIQRRIFYRELLPLDIKDIMTRKDNNKTYNLSFKRFTDDDIIKADIFLNFLETSRRQASFVNVNLPTLEEIRNNKAFGDIQVNYLTYKQEKFNMPYELFNKPLQAYVKINNTNVSIPVKEHIILTATIEDTSIPIKINDTVYYSSFKRIIEAEVIKIQVGESLYISMAKDKYEPPFSINFQYEPATKLEERIKDLEFCIDFIEQKHLYLGDFRLPIDDEFASRINFDIEHEKGRLNYFKKISRVLAELGCTENIEISKFTETDWHIISLLINSIIDKKPNKTTVYQEPHLLKYKVLSYSLLTVYIPYQDTRDEFMICPFDDDNRMFSYLDEKGNRHPLLRYYLLSPNEYTECCFKDIGEIYQTLRAEKDKVAVKEQVLKILFDLINAYDISNTNGERFLLEALKIANWCLNIRKLLQMPLDYAKINIFQIKMRLRTFDEADKISICEILTKRTTPETQFGASVLLDRREDAEKQFTLLKEKDKEFYKKLPIYTLYLKMNESEV